MSILYSFLIALGIAAATGLVFLWAAFMVYLEGKIGPKLAYIWAGAVFFLFIWAMSYQMMAEL